MSTFKKNFTKSELPGRKPNPPSSVSNIRGSFVAKKKEEEDAKAALAAVISSNKENAVMPDTPLRLKKRVKRQNLADGFPEANLKAKNNHGISAGFNAANTAPTMLYGYVAPSTMAAKKKKEEEAKAAAAAFFRDVYPTFENLPLVSILPSPAAVISFDKKNNVVPDTPLRLKNRVKRRNVADRFREANSKSNKNLGATANTAVPAVVGTYTAPAVVKTLDFSSISV